MSSAEVTLGPQTLAQAQPKISYFRPDSIFVVDDKKWIRFASVITRLVCECVWQHLCGERDKQRTSRCELGLSLALVWIRSQT